MCMGDSLVPDRVRPLLRGCFGREYVYVERCESTQRLLADDAPEGAVAVADEQTEGRGRLGRRWYAPAGTSVLCSVLLRPSTPTPSWPQLSLIAGEACAAAIAEVAGVETTIKPPNDVLIGGGKVAGILAEASEDVVRLGIGINVNVAPDQLPVTDRTPPTSLLTKTGRFHDRAVLLAVVLDKLEGAYARWLTDDDGARDVADGVDGEDARATGVGMRPRDDDGPSRHP